MPPNISDVLQVEDATIRRMSVHNPDVAEMIEKGREATRQEHEMTLWEA
jgi:hypothetical protein